MIFGEKIQNWEGKKVSIFLPMIPKVSHGFLKKKFSQIGLAV